MAVLVWKQGACLSCALSDPPGGDLDSVEKDESQTREGVDWDKESSETGTGVGRETEE